MTGRARSAAIGVCLAAMVAWNGPVGAEIAVSANDGKQILDNGVPKVPAEVVPDTVSFIDMAAKPPKVIAEIEAPATVIGPPMAVAVAPDESFAIVTGGMALDPSDRTKQVPDDKVTVIDLKAKPPRVIATLQAGKAVAGVSINRTGTLALVANRGEGTVSVFSIKGNVLTPKGDKIALGDDKSGPSGVVFSRDGTAAYVTRDGDSKISVLSVQGDTVTYTKRDLNAGLRPYGIDTTGAGHAAVVANIGIGAGDEDTISLIDLAAKPPRVVRTVTVGQTPEGLKMSPDGTLVAVGVMNGSNKPKDSPFWSKGGALQIWRITGRDLAKVAEAPVGIWCQGIVWSKDGRSLVVQCMADREMRTFAFDGRRLVQTSVIAMKNGPSSIRTAEP